MYDTRGVVQQKYQRVVALRKFRTCGTTTASFATICHVSDNLQTLQQWQNAALRLEA